MPDADGPLYLQLASTLRDRIQHGVYPPDMPMPVESDICREHGFSRMTVRRALAVLREEGLISTKRGLPSFVRSDTARQILVLQQKDRLVSRMPSRQERAEFDLDAGVPLIEVRRADGSSNRYAADQVEVVGH